MGYCGLPNETVHFSVCRVESRRTQLEKRRVETVPADAGFNKNELFSLLLGEMRAAEKLPVANGAWVCPGLAKSEL
jgi:hypothetical protein